MQINSTLINQILTEGLTKELRGTYEDGWELTSVKAYLESKTEYVPSESDEPYAYGTTVEFDEIVIYGTFVKDIKGKTQTKEKEIYYK